MKMQYTYTGAPSGTNNFDFVFTTDSVIFNGNIFIIGGRDIVNNYNILRFNLGVTPATNTYSISYGQG
jgi:hypothetical protein